MRGIKCGGCGDAAEVDAGVAEDEEVVLEIVADFGFGWVFENGFQRGEDGGLVEMIAGSWRADELRTEVRRLIDNERERDAAALVQRQGEVSLAAYLEKRCRADSADAWLLDRLCRDLWVGDNIATVEAALCLPTQGGVHPSQVNHQCTATGNAGSVTAQFRDRKKTWSKGSLGPLPRSLGCAHPHSLAPSHSAV